MDNKLASENLAKIDQIQNKIKVYEEARKEFAQDQESVLKTLFKWKAPERIFVKKDRKFFILIAALFVIGIVVSAILENLMFILVLVALLTLIYINHSVPPREVEHEITNQGVKTYNRIYLWKHIQNFWFTRREGHLLLNIDIKERIEDRLILLIGEKEAKAVTKELIKYVSYLDKPEANFITKYTEGEFAPIVEFLEVQDVPTPSQKPAPTPPAQPVSKQ